MSSFKSIKNLECLCFKDASAKPSSASSISKAKINGTSNLRATFSCRGEIHHSTKSKPVIIAERGVKQKLTAVADIDAKLSARAGLLARSITGIGEITSGVMTADYSVRQKVEGIGVLSPTFLDKFAGDFKEYECLEKLYPSGDLELDAGMKGFVDRNLESGNLYTSIDEGVIVGDDYHKHLGLGSVISDDAASWITPNSFHTEGTFQYKSELTNFHIRPDETRIRFRASAPC